MMISQRRSESNVLSNSQIKRMRGYANDGTQQFHEIALDLRNKPPVDQGLSLCHDTPRETLFCYCQRYYVVVERYGNILFFHVYVIYLATEK